MTTFYIHKGVGSDANTGLSWAQAWSSLTKAQAAMGTNDTVYVRAGATPYYEKLRVEEGQRWLADTGHTPIIDGKYHDGVNPNLWGLPPNTYVVQRTGPTSPPIVTVKGPNAELNGFFVRNVAGDGINIGGHSNLVKNCRTDYCYNVSISVNGGPGRKNCYNNVIDNCEASRGSIVSFANVDLAPGHWKGVAAVTVALKNCHHCTVRNTKVHHNMGEGIVMATNADYCLAEYCLSYNNNHVNYYINNSIFCTVRYCVGISNGLEEMLRQGEHAAEPIILSQETVGNNVTATPWMHGAVIHNCIFIGGRSVMGLARQGKTVTKDGVTYRKNNTTLKECYIGFNTFIALDPSVTYAALAPGDPYQARHTDSVFENNIVYLPPGVAMLQNNAQMAGLSGRGNIIYRRGGGATIPGFAAGPGSAVVDPKLVNPEAVIIDNGGIYDNPPDGTLIVNLNNYKLTSTSPGVNAAQTGSPFGGINPPAEARQKDHFGASRSQPDIGAHEFGGTVANSVTAAFGRTPSGTTLVEGTQVTFTNASWTTGTTSITGYAWEVKKGASVVHTAATQNLAYTFATDGSYTVKLTVTATGGLSDDEQVAFTITNPVGGVVVTAAFSRSPVASSLPKDTSLTVSDVSTIQNGTFGSRLWQMLTLPGLTEVATATTKNWTRTLDSVGNFRIRLTETAATGQSDVEEQDITVTTTSTATVTAAYTASDADLVIDEGDSITFTNTSSATGTTLSGYTWTVTRHGVSGETIYETTNITHTFPQAGIYTVRLLANTAAGVSDSHEETVTVRGETAGGMVFMAVPTAFTVNTSGGAQTITNAALAGLVPKGVHVRLVGSTVTGTAANGAMWAEGAADGTDQWVEARWSKDASADTVSRRRRRGGALLMTLDDAGAKTGEAVFVKFVANGMEINVTDGFPAGYQAEATFFAGDDCRFWAGNVSIGTKDSAVPVVTGFQPDAVYVCATWAPGEDTAETRAYLSRGWATREGGQWCFSHEDRNARPSSELFARHTVRVATSTEGDGKEYGGTCQIDAGGWSNTGFTLTPRASSLNRTAGAFAFATGGPLVQLSAAALDTGASSAHEVGFEAQTVLALTSTTRGQGLFGGLDAVGMGGYAWSTHGPYSRSLSIASANGAATSSTRSLAATGMRAVNHDGSNLWNGTATADEDSFDIAWSAAPAYGYMVVLLAVEAAAAVDPGDEPLADFEADIDFGENNNGRVVVWFDSSLSNGRGEEITGYLWEFGDGETSAEARPMHIYESPGEYTVSLTVTTAAGSHTKTVEGFLAYDLPAPVSWLVGLSEPGRSGGDTGNEIDEETMWHSHQVAGPWVNIEALDEEGVAAFVAQEPDPVYARAAYDVTNHRWVIQEPDGTIRYGATTA